MRDVPRIEGSPDPRRTSPKHRGDEIDPEKFKRVMKVEESDELQKRHKRHRAEEEDEVEEEEEDQATKQAAPGFSALMDETERRDSLFDVEGGPQEVRSTGEQALQPDQTGSLFQAIPSSQKRNTFAPNVPQGLLLPSGEEDAPAPKEGGEEIQPMTQKEKLKLAQKHAKNQLTRAIHIAKKRVDTPPSDAKAQPLNISSSLSQEKEAPPSPPPKKKAHQAEEVAETFSSFEPEKKKIESHPTPADAETLALEKEKTTQRQLPAESSHDQSKDRQDKEPFIEELQASSELTAPLAELASTTETQQPAYTSLNSQVHALFERMVGLITVQQASGESKTTVTLNMPGSIFHSAEIVLEKSTTSPTLNIQFFGSPQAVAMFNHNLDDLVAAFRQSQHSFEVHIQRAYLLKQYRYTTKKTEGATEGDKQGDQEDEEPKQHG